MTTDSSRIYTTAQDLADRAEQFSLRHPVNVFPHLISDAIRREANAIWKAADHEPTPFPAELVALDERLQMALKIWRMLTD